MADTSATIQQAAQIFLDRKIDCLPVRDPKARLVGIVTSTDILKAFVEFTRVLEETRRNLALTHTGLSILEIIIHQARIEIVSVTGEQIREAMKWIFPKDAPILAAAKAAKADMLVSLDKKHILGHAEFAGFINAPVLTPAEAFERLIE